MNGSAVRWGALALVGVLLLAGCARPESAAAPAASPVGSEPGPARSQDAVVTVDVVGDVTFSWQREVPLQIVVLTPSAREGHLLSIGILRMVPVDDEHEQFRFAFDLVGGYDGAGTYVIPGRGGAAVSEGELPSGPVSTAFLAYMRLIDPSLENPYDLENVELLRGFDRVQQDCVLEVGAGEQTGTLDCPELADAEGRTVALRATWRPPLG